MLALVNARVFCVNPVVRTNNQSFLSSPVELFLNHHASAGTVMGFSKIRVSL